MIQAYLRRTFGLELAVANADDGAGFGSVRRRWWLRGPA